MISQKKLEGKPDLDARTFQQKLDDLTTTIALKVQREGVQQGIRPVFVAADLYFILRQAQQTYNLFFFVNADKRRFEDSDWRSAYAAVMLPLVRSMIDCLYNITAILQDPAVNGTLFRKSGYRLMLESLDADESRYGTDPKWSDWIARQRSTIRLDMRANGFDETQVRAEKKLWPTLSGYLRIDKNATPTSHQEFLKKLTFGFWQEYSGISHATFQGLLPIALFLSPKDLPHDDRPKVDAASESLIAVHIPRVAALLLCMITEIQVYFQFDGARINQRLHEIWNALIVAPEVRELFDGRYEQLLREKGINAK